MQDRLMRSRHDRMISGVCGGLGVYFEIDPTIVRLVMVLLAFAGIGLVLYPALWIVMPSELPGSGRLPPAPPQNLGNSWQAPYVPPANYDPRTTQNVGAPDSGRFRFDPYTGQPLPPASAQVATPSTGQTVQLDEQLSPDAAVVPPYMPMSPTPPAFSARQRNKKPVLGLILVGIGILAFASNLGIDDFVMPLLLIGLGFVLLMRQRRQQP
jgi:phage shock protein PspC (stress-responsive transcriptional regulator)